MASSATKTVTVQKSGYSAYYLTMDITVNSQNVANNTSNVTVHMYARGSNSSASAYNLSASNQVTLVVDGSTVVSKKIAMDFRNQQTVELATWTGNVSHSTDGTKTLACSGSFSISGAASLSGGSVSLSITLNTIARATTPTLSDTTLLPGETITITLPRASSSFYHKVYSAFVTGQDVVSASAGASCSWTVPMSYADRIPNKTTSWGRIIVETYTNSNMTTLVGTKEVRYDFSIPDTSAYYPTITSVAIEEGNSEVTAAVGQIYVQNRSKLHITTAAAGVYSSSVSSISHTIGSTTYAASADYTSDPITVSGTVNVVTTVKDSRGRSTSYTSTITVYPYNIPQISQFGGFRCDAQGAQDGSGTRGSITSAYEVSELGGSNADAYVIEYKASSASAYTILASGNAYSYSDTLVTGEIFSVGDTYTVRLTVTDSFTSASATFQIGTAVRLLSYVIKKNALAVGKVAELADTFEVDLDAVFNQSLQASSAAVTGALTVGGDSVLTAPAGQTLIDLALADFLVVKTVTLATNVTTAAGATTATYTIPQKAGYEIAAITPKVGGSNWGRYSYSLRYSTTNGGGVYFHNWHTSSLTNSFYATVIYIKSTT